MACLSEMGELVHEYELKTGRWPLFELQIEGDMAVPRVAGAPAALHAPVAEVPGLYAHAAGKARPESLDIGVEGTAVKIPDQGFPPRGIKRRRGAEFDGACKGIEICPAPAASGRQWKDPQRQRLSPQIERLSIGIGMRPLAPLRFDTAALFLDPDQPRLDKAFDMGVGHAIGSGDPDYPIGRIDGYPQRPHILSGQLEFKRADPAPSYCLRIPPHVLPSRFLLCPRAYCGKSIGSAAGGPDPEPAPQSELCPQYADTRRALSPDLARRQPAWASGDRASRSELKVGGQSFKVWNGLPCTEIPPRLS